VDRDLRFLAQNVDLIDGPHLSPSLSSPVMVVQAGDQDPSDVVEPVERPEAWLFKKGSRLREPRRQSASLRTTVVVTIKTFLVFRSILLVW
jgi:hypothetical protein